MKSFKEFLNEAPYMYHGTTKNLDDDRVRVIDRGQTPIDRALGGHFAADPEVSKKFAAGLYSHGHDKPQQGNLYRTKAPKRSELQVVPQKRRKFQHYTAVASDQASIGSYVAGTVFHHDKEMFKTWVKRARRVDDDTAEQLHAHIKSGRAPSDEKKWGLASAKNANSFRSYVDNFDSTMIMSDKEFREKLVGKFIDIMKSKGKKGLVYHNTSPMETDGVRSKKSYVIFHPEEHPLEKVK